MGARQGSREGQVHQGRAAGGAILKLNTGTAVSVCTAPSGTQTVKSTAAQTQQTQPY